MDIFVVRLAKEAEKSLRKIPPYIALKFHLWVMAIETVGLRAVRKNKSLHDEPLQGKRIGQRSVRLNKAYRAIYVEKFNGTVELIEVIEVNKHDY